MVENKHVGSAPTAAQFRAITSNEFAAGSMPYMKPKVMWSSLCGRHPRGSGRRVDATVADVKQTSMECLISASSH